MSKISKIIVVPDTGGVTYYFDDSEQPFSTLEFEPGTRVFRILASLEDHLLYVNEELDR